MVSAVSAAWCLRCAMNHPEIEIVGINDLCPADYLAYMLKYDTMHGKFDGDVYAEEQRHRRQRQGASPSPPSATPPTCPGPRWAPSTSSSPPACS